MRRALSAVTLLGAALLPFILANVNCHQALFTAPPGTQILLIANPESIPATGGVSVISAILTEAAGTPVADGTVVQFFTNLGRIDPAQARTNDGVARANFLSNGRSGEATITAFSGGGSAAPAPTPSGSGSPTPGGGGGGGATSNSVKVKVGTPEVRSIIVTANPPRITDSRSTHVFANVFDANGNPIPGVPVFFSVDQDPATEFMDSAGAPIFTDNNGRSEDVMRTRRTASGVAKVRAAVPIAGSASPAPPGGVTSGLVDIPIVFQ